MQIAVAFPSWQSRLEDVDGGATTATEILRVAQNDGSGAGGFSATA
jgi:hypothetical protein